MSSLAVLGLRPHTYWTAAAVVGGQADAPQVLWRERLVFAGPGEKFPFHRAAEVPLAAAPGLIEASREACAANLAGAVTGLCARMVRRGVEVRLAATAAATAKLPDGLADILASHSRIHTAEGDFARDVVADACRAAGLEVRRAVERELPALTADLLGVGQTELAARLKTMGAALGPPWSEDYKLAVQAAWLQLPQTANA
jgi:hypothetical protein